MKMQFDDGEVREVKAYSIAYPNDILDGVLLDMPDVYAYLSDHVASQRDVMEDLNEMEFHDLSDCEIDYDEIPHKWVVEAVGKLIVHTAEKITEEAG